VFGLGLVTLLLSRFVVPEQLYPWLTLVSGVLVVVVGLGVFRGRLAQRRRHVQAHGHDHHRDSHPHGHEHAHDLGPRSLVGVGVAAGLLPCPSALVVLLSAIALHRLAFGLILIVAFSVGLAVAITGIGLVAVLARRVFARARFDGPLVRALPAVSAAVIVVAGVAITARALPRVF
jgi:ABC-type nickel/cobalt efflux system permease component RcnA